MKRMILVLAARVALAAELSGVSWNQGGDPAVPQGTCPVMGEVITSKEHYVDYRGKRIYFCCAGCPEEFNRDPEKYFQKLDPAKLENAPGSTEGGAAPHEEHNHR